MTMPKRKRFLDRVIERLGGVTKADASRRAVEAHTSGFEDGEDEPASGDLRKFGYRRSISGSIRDFGGLDYDKVLDTVWRVWLMSPLAKRALELRRDYIVGGGVKPIGHRKKMPTTGQHRSKATNLRACGRMPPDREACCVDLLGFPISRLKREGGLPLSGLFIIF